jgi:hypothetical protein
MAQIILEDLPYKERLKLLEELEKQSESRKTLVSNLQKGSNKYEITQDAQLAVLEKPITHTITKTEWEVSYKTISQIEAEIIVLKEEQELDGGWYELFNLMKKLTLPLQKINFELSDKGHILSILNQKDILNKWNDVKKEFVNDESFAKMIQLGDADYSNPLQSIKKNIIYQLFFFSLYRSIYSLNKSILVERNVFMQSVIFPECCFNVDIEEKAYESDGEYVFYNQYTNDKRADYDKINSLYKDKYKRFMVQNTGKDEGVDNYSISYRSNYKVFDGLGKLVHCKALFEEKVNKNLYYKSDIEIKLID